MATAPKAADSSMKASQKSLISTISENDPGWQENPYAAADSARAPIATSKIEDRVVELLTDDLSEARRHFGDAMGKKWDWHTDEYSIFQSERNFNYFEPRIAAWLECAKNAISRRFHALLQLRSREVGLDPRESVRQTGELVLAIVHRQCWLNDAFRSISFLDRLPDGVPDRQASHEPVSSYLPQLMGLVCSHVEQLRGEALVELACQAGKGVRQGLKSSKGRRRGRQFRSKFRQAIAKAFIDNPKASALEICRIIDDEGYYQLEPEKWAGCESLECAYSKRVLRNRLDAEISRVRQED